jgi:hypothetical protein
MMLIYKLFKSFGVLVKRDYSGIVEILKVITLDKY